MRLLFIISVVLCNFYFINTQSIFVYEGFRSNPILNKFGIFKDDEIGVNCNFPTATFIKTVYGNDLYACKYLCFTTQDCTNFFWNPNVINYNYTCTLYSGGKYKKDAVYVSNTGKNPSYCGVLPQKFPEISEWRDNYALNCDLPDQDLEAVSSNDHFDCRYKCTVNKQCTHYAYTEEYCYLKTGFRNRSSANFFGGYNSACGIIQERQPGIQWVDDFAYNCDLDGDIRYYDVSQVRNSYECKIKCLNNRRCNQYTFNPYDKCILKKGDATKSSVYDLDSYYLDNNFYGIVCGFINEKQNEIVWKDEYSYGYNCDLYGQDLYQITTDSHFKCKIECMELKQCSHYLFYPKNTCYLKTGTRTKDEATYNPTVKSVCGIILEKQPIITWNGDYGYNCDLPNYNLSRAFNLDHFACRSLCFDTIACTHYVWDPYAGNACYLKNVIRNSSHAVLSSAALSGDFGVMCGFIREKQPQISWIKNYGFNSARLSNDFKIVYHLTQSECANLCMFTKSCTHYNWNPYFGKGNACFLKKYNPTKLYYWFDRKAYGSVSEIIPFKTLE